MSHEVSDQGNLLKAKAKTHMIDTTGKQGQTKLIQHSPSKLTIIADQNN